MSVFMRSGCDYQGMVRSETICAMIFKTRDSQASQYMQCLLSPYDATGHQKFTLNLVTALNITASFFFFATCNSHYFCRSVYILRFESRPLPSFGHLYIASLHQSILSHLSYGENHG